jgi:hypothetical protein
MPSTIKVCGATSGIPGSFPQPPAGSPVLASPVLDPVSAAVASLELPIPVPSPVVGAALEPPVSAAPVVGPALLAVPSDIPLEPAGPVLSVVVVAEDPPVQAASTLASNKTLRIGRP